MKVEKLLKDVEYECSDINLLDMDVDDISYDTRDIKENSLFIAYKGEAFDSHSKIKSLIKDERIKCFITEKKIDGVDSIVVKNGRKALALVSKNFFLSGYDFKNIGITGTNGKTTTLYLIDHILKTSNFKTVRIGTVNYEVDGEVYQADNTTPGPYEFYKLISKGVEKGCEWLVSEISSHALKQDRVYGMEFDFAVFTNLSGDHLDYHMDMEDYFLSKMKLFTGEYLRGEGIVNVDDEYGRRLKSKNDRFLTYGIENDADVKVLNYKTTLEGTEIDIELFGEKATLYSNLVGRYNVYNILAAVLVCYRAGIELPIIYDALKSFKNVPGRLDKIEWNKRFFFVDYAHTDDALKNVLRSLAPFKRNRIITLFGCGGDRDRSKRPRMAKVAEQFSDLVIITSDNPRNEDPVAIIEDIKKGIKDFSKVLIIPDRREAIEKSVRISEAGDIVLIAGKGHEDYQLIKGVKYHFDDKEEILRCLT